MDEGAKRRLVGAAVIVVLMVIFLPMLVEEEAVEPVSDEDLSIPQQPAFDQSFDASVAPALEEPVVAPVPQELSTPALYQEPETTETVPAPVPEQVPQAWYEESTVAQPEPIREQAPTPAPAPEPEPAPEPAAAPESASAEPAPQPQPTPRTVAPDGSSWIIQVASLSDTARAKKLVQDLRGNGYAAFVEQATVGAKTFHRVRVGPEGDRSRIESMAAKLKQQTGLNVQIQSYRR